MNNKKSITETPLSIILFAGIILLACSFIITPSIFAQKTNSTMLLLPSSSLAPSPMQPPPLLGKISPQQIAASTNKTCSLTPSSIEIEGTPQQIEGPYYVAGIPNRSDIRADPSDGSVQEGIPLNVVINVYKIGNNNGNNKAFLCTPLSGARVDIWHSNSQGVYSGVKQIGTEGKAYLRGYQITDGNGTVKFNTIYPGWYEGRAIHIHVMVRTLDGGDNERVHWTSQIYLNNSINAQVHTQLPYSKHGPPPMTNEQDGIYTGPSTDGLIQSNTGKHLMLYLTKDKHGYNGTFNIVVNAFTNSKH